MSNAERQRRFRQRHLKEIDSQRERLNVVISLHAKKALDRLATHYCVTKRDALERVLRDAEARLLNGLTSAEQERYFDSAPTVGGLRSNHSDEP